MNHKCFLIIVEIRTISEMSNYLYNYGSKIELYKIYIIGIIFNINKML
jgi:hypothetical protein